LDWIDQLDKGPGWTNSSHSMSQQGIEQRSPALHLDSKNQANTKELQLRLQLVLLLNL
jgi:hypothetical protein